MGRSFKIVGLVQDYVGAEKKDSDIDFYYGEFNEGESVNLLQPQL